MLVFYSVVNGALAFYSRVKEQEQYGVQKERCGSWYGFELSDPVVTALLLPPQESPFHHLHGVDMVPEDPALANARHERDAEEWQLIAKGTRCWELAVLEREEISDRMYTVRLCEARVLLGCSSNGGILV